MGLGQSVSVDNFTLMKVNQSTADNWPLISVQLTLRNTHTHTSVATLTQTHDLTTFGLLSFMVVNMDTHSHTLIHTHTGLHPSGGFQLSCTSRAPPRWAQR